MPLSIIRAMPLSPGLAASRRLIAIVCAVVAVAAVVGAVAYAASPTGNDCGNGWQAATKPLPSPLLTPDEVERILRENLNRYEAGVAKARPIEECRRAGARRLITAGVGAGLVLLPVAGILAFLYWPRREDMVIDLDDDEPSRPPVSPTGKDWAGR